MSLSVYQERTDLSQWTVESYASPHETINFHSTTECAPSYSCEYEQHAIHGMHCSAQPTTQDCFGIVGFKGASKRIGDMVEEFLADLGSLEPFSYPMVVRESARRSEIQRRILRLPDNIKVRRNNAENHRIASWDGIKGLKDGGEDWKPQRDQYLASLRLDPGQMSSLRISDKEMLPAPKVKTYGESFNNGFHETKSPEGIMVQPKACRMSLGWP
ncbi:hypothetical protein NPX13_g8231 [Xylaria arbuscula]|uniref:Uncharacterized protein n=1 Tax=Xylaria arbuscula TaxID=114810 RepID=A0A9W8N8T6_9PEZI|nr:hypothetical protein NPX13_g8231 [Xylaria arbuscula]